MDGCMAGLTGFPSKITPLAIEVFLEMILNSMKTVRTHACGLE